MTIEQPCANPENNPDHWFISRDGRQYPDEELLTESERSNIARSVLTRAGETPEEHERRVRRAINMAASDRRRKALQDRRHAREACYSCPVRVECLQTAVALGALHGTWGGMYEEEISQMREGRKDVSEQ